MDGIKTLQAATTFSLAFLLLNSSPAYAYLDPGTGSIILQGIVGAISATFVLIRIYWHRVLQFFGLKKKVNEQNSDEALD